MVLECREWAGPLRVGTRTEAYGRLVELKEALTPVLAGYPSARFLARAYFETESMENDLLVPAVLLAIAGALPVLWLNVTYEDRELPADALGEVERLFELRSLGEFRRIE